tara:strand:- start:26 stop:361 length:336 start_codon:yes stop_codon:yes gene_type:complete
MNLDILSEKLNKINHSLKNDKSYETILENLKEKPEIKQEYYDSLYPLEKIYQKKNDDYKILISKFSKAYLDICDFYVGPELPRKHESTFLDDKDSIHSLYFLFFMSIFLKN